MNGQRYFSINDVANITRIPISTIRLLEKNCNRAEHSRKIRGRIYYTKEFITLLAPHTTPEQSNPEFTISQINNLISKFSSLISRS